jgi:hypothetical protein
MTDKKNDINDDIAQEHRANIIDKMLENQQKAYEAQMAEKIKIAAKNMNLNQLFNKIAVNETIHVNKNGDSFGPYLGSNNVEHVSKEDNKYQNVWNVPAYPSYPFPPNSFPAVDKNGYILSESTNGFVGSGSNMVMAPTLSSHSHGTGSNPVKSVMPIVDFNHNSVMIQNNLFPYLQINYNVLGSPDKTILKNMMTSLSEFLREEFNIFAQRLPEDSKLLSARFKNGLVLNFSPSAVSALIPLADKIKTDEFLKDAIAIHITKKCVAAAIEHGLTGDKKVTIELDNEFIKAVEEANSAKSMAEFKEYFEQARKYTKDQIQQLINLKKSIVFNFVKKTALSAETIAKIFDRSSLLTAVNERKLKLIESGMDQNHTNLNALRSEADMVVTESLKLLEFSHVIGAMSKEELISIANKAVGNMKIEDLFKQKIEEQKSVFVFERSARIKGIIAKLVKIYQEMITGSKVPNNAEHINSLKEGIKRLENASNLLDLVKVDGSEGYQKLNDIVTEIFEQESKRIEEFKKIEINNQMKNKQQENKVATARIDELAQKHEEVNQIMRFLVHHRDEAHNLALSVMGKTKTNSLKSFIRYCANKGDILELNDSINQTDPTEDDVEAAYDIANEMLYDYLTELAGLLDITEFESCDELNNLEIESDNSSMEYIAEMHNSILLMLGKHVGVLDDKFNLIDDEDAEEEEEEEESSTEKKTMTKGIVDTLKNDSKLVLRRVAARKIVSVARDMLVAMVTVGKSKKEANTIKASIGAILETENGKAAIGFFIGATLPMIKMQLPAKYHQVAEDMAQEFRVEGMAHFGTTITEFVTGPAFQAAKGMITGALDEAMGSSEESEHELGASTGLRATLEPIKKTETVSHDEDEHASKVHHKRGK